MLSIKDNPEPRPSLLILEDDPDQMVLLVSLVNREIEHILQNEVLNQVQRQVLETIQIFKSDSINSLRAAIAAQDNVVLALLDCNTPDKRGGQANDQFVKTNFVITGQHAAVDVVINHEPKTPITLISSMGRFQRIVSKYYAANDSLAVAFINKDDTARIANNVRHHIKKYIQQLT